jgi:diguanylate cyclase (GGDEF)-like protein
MTSEQQLSDVLSEFARTMVTDCSIQAILDHLVERIVDILPVTAAGVTLMAPDAVPRYVAASNGAALWFEELQTELGEGPRLASYRTGEVVKVADLRHDFRFLDFVPRALEAGLAAMFTCPLRNGAQRLGALDLYRDSPGPLDAGAMAAAQTLAEVAAAYLVNAQTRADLRQSLARTHDNALHDVLTGLPNRTLLLEHLDHAVRRAIRSGKAAALLFVDLDGFKQFNDRHGHSRGDELLIAVTKRLSDTLRSGDILARLSGDEFVILCEDICGPAPVDVIAGRITRALDQPFDLGPTRVSISASIGIAFSGPGYQLSDNVLKEAGTALYQAKHTGGGRHQIIDLREQHRAEQQAALEHDLKGASSRGELRTVYQPIVDTANGRITGVEALLRWAHPSLGAVSPGVVIPLAERSGMISEIGQWVLNQACRDRLRWQSRGTAAELSISVNVSARQLMAPDFTTTVADILAQTYTDPRQVTLEVTESVFVEDGERALVVLGDLKHLGVHLALDDFGTGYASLNYLKRFPIEIVKIDQGFVAEMERDPANHAIVSAVIDLAHKLDMTVIAEGVETSSQHQQLETFGCDSCQGYYFARPMGAGDLDILMHPSRASGTLHLPVPSELPAG